jgi:hypothetical protein
MASEALVSGYPYAAQSRNPFNYSKFEQVSRDLTSTWLTTEEIKQQLNLYEDTSQDTYLASLEKATRFAIEDYLGMSFFPVTYRVWYGAEGLVASPTSLDLPEVSQNTDPLLPPLTVSSVGYWNSSSPSVFTTISASQYYYDNSGNKIILNGLPSDINSNMTAPIVAEYVTVANYMKSYPVIKWAGLLLLTHLYNNRANSTETQLKDIPFGVTTLLRQYKPLVL